MDSDHLGNNLELVMFTQDMQKELEKHANEKTPLRNWTINNVVRNSVFEIEHRIKQIQKSSSLPEIKKQSLHIANYALFMYLKSKMEMKE